MNSYAAAEYIIIYYVDDYTAQLQLDIMGTV